MEKETVVWAKDAFENIIKKMSFVYERSKDKIPYTTINGVHDDHSVNDIGWWTNGFWGGIMWQLYIATGEECYKKTAIENEKKLDKLFLNYKLLDHDNGFKWLPTAVANYRITGDEESKNRGILAADNLAGRFNVNGEFIRAWNDWDGDNIDRRGWAIIDCMMNLPLLYWASETTNDPRYRHVAIKHANKAQKHFVRENGSVKHIVEFDVETGKEIRDYGGQGYRDGSSWTRGQSWGIYGFALSYDHTKDIEYLKTAEKIADNFIQNIPESGLIPVDFDQPKEVTWEDSTAAAIAACGMLKISEFKECSDKDKYFNTALKLLKTLTDCRVNLNEKEDDLLLKCTAAYNDKIHDFSIIYGDYFYIEAICKLNGKYINIW
ncbi:MAG: glycoside hydrolase family 88 protein [Butyrivibrio sp.]|nr:glycoside hydrolase family 88 protein [Butyrivibrio sp.]